MRRCKSSKRSEAFKLQIGGGVKNRAYFSFAQKTCANVVFHLLTSLVKLHFFMKIYLKKHFLSAKLKDDSPHSASGLLYNTYQYSECT